MIKVTQSYNLQILQVLHAGDLHSAQILMFKGEE